MNILIDQIMSWPRKSQKFLQPPCVAPHQRDAVTVTTPTLPLFALQASCCDALVFHEPLGWASTAPKRVVLVGIRFNNDEKAFVEAKTTWRDQRTTTFGSRCPSHGAVAYS